MAKRSLRTWIRHAAAVFSGQHGAVTRQAEQADWSRETVSQHARKLEPRLASEPATDAAAELRAENQRLRQQIAERERAAEGVVRCDKAEQRRLATAVFAMGLSLRTPAGSWPGTGGVSRRSGSGRRPPARRSPRPRGRAAMRGA